MTKKARLITIISVLLAAGASFYLVGCDADTTGPTDPQVNYLPQNFSLAIADGNASNDGFGHNGVAVITLDWNGSPGTNTVAPKYVYEYAGQPYPRIDGGLVGDATTWALAEETVLTLGSVYGNGGVTTVRVKSVYTFVNPPRVWFLLQWDDNATRQDNPGYLGNHWEVVSKTGGADDWWNNIWADNEDWVAFMWDTWHKDYPDGYWYYPNPDDKNHHLHDTPKNPSNWVFVGKAQGFQTNGCTVTCHEDSTDHPHAMINTTYDYDHHWATPGVDPGYVDLWMWTGTRTNYTANLFNWASGTNDPAFMFDCYLDRTGIGWGSNNSFPRDADNNYVDWLVFDGGGSGPYLVNEDQNAAGDLLGYPEYGATGDPGANEKYLWLSDEAVQEMGPADPLSPTDDRWNIGDRVAAYVHRTALGGAADVHGHGGWEETNGVGTWTLEVGRNIGGTYDEINSDEDVFLGIYEAHPDQ
ncbi:MAG: hypothetical protein JSW52_09445 [Candidatus Coatesbacteria bacterium]|nr:MAG: hypothetical protein JSW52_09445 [Candidatus Coatesbacteria bacterium]